MNIVRTYTECASFLYISCTAFPRDTGCSSDRKLNECKYMHVLCSIAITSANEFTHLLIRWDSLGLYIPRLIFSLPRMGGMSLETLECSNYWLSATEIRCFQWWVTTTMWKYGLRILCKYNITKLIPPPKSDWVLGLWEGVQDEV